MARVTTVEKARAVPGLRRCGRCGKDIGAGEKYFHWSNRAPGGRGGHKSVRCSDHYPRPSEVVGSPYLQAAYGAVEGLEDDLAANLSIEDLAGSLDNAASDVENEIAEPLNESADNIEEGFGHETFNSQEIRERAESYQDWADSIREASSELTDMLAMIEEECEEEDCTHEECETYQEKYEEARSLVEEVISGCPE